MHEAEAGAIVIKKRTQSLPPATARVFIAVDRALNGSLTPKRIYTADDLNKPQIESENGLFFEATRYIENNPRFDWQKPTWQAEHCRSMGKAARLFHQASPTIANVLSPKTQKELDSLLPAIPANLPQRLARCESAVRFDSAWKQQLIDCAKGAIKNIGRTAPSSHVIVHGDLHPGNLLFVGTEATALIDFDFAHFEPIEYDLAYAAIMLSLPVPLVMVPGSTSTKRRLEMAEAFIDGYQSQFSTDERCPKWLSKPFNKVLEHLNPFTKLCAILIFVWMLEQGEIDSASGFESISIFEALFHWLS